MIRIILFVSVILGAIYGSYKLLVYISHSLLLIDEYFTNSIKDSKDIILRNLMDKLEKNKENKKEINRHLRFDFFISIILGLLWFTFPIIFLDNFDTNKIQQLALLTIISSIISIELIKHKKLLVKRLFLLIRLVTLILILVGYVHIFYRKKFNSINFINIFFIVIYIGNCLIPLNKITI